MRNGIQQCRGVLYHVLIAIIEPSTIVNHATRMDVDSPVCHCITVLTVRVSIIPISNHSVVKTKARTDNRKVEQSRLQMSGSSAQGTKCNQQLCTGHDLEDKSNNMRHNIPVCISN